MFMITLLVSILFFICLCLGIVGKLKFEPFMMVCFPMSALLFICVLVLVFHTKQTNELKAQNIHMLPKDILEKNIAVKNAELNDIKEQIKKAGDENQSQGLGDVERGGAEKLNLLENLIKKQKEIANELIHAQKEISREEYYKRNAEIMVYENSIFDGILVRWFSIKSNQNLNLIENRVYYPN